MKIGLNTCQDLTSALSGQRRTTLRTVLNADLGVQQSQVVRQLGHGGNGRIPSTPTHTLLNGHRGRNTGQQIDIRPGEDFNELPRVGGQTVNIAALAFGVDQIKDQCRLA